MIARDVMTRPVITVQPNLSVGEAASIYPASFFQKRKKAVGVAAENMTGGKAVMPVSSH